MEIWETEAVACGIPARTEPEEIGEGRVGIPGSRGQHCVYGRVGVVDGSRVLRREFGKVVL